MSDWSPECEALFEAGREMSDDPGPEDRRRVARGVAARLAIGAGVVTTAEAGRAATVGAAAAGGLAAKAPSLLTAGKVLLCLAVGVGGSFVVGSVLSRPRGAVPSAESAPPNATPPPPLVASVPMHTVPAIEPPSDASPLAPPILPKAVVRPARSAAAMGSRSSIVSSSPAPNEERKTAESGLAPPSPAISASAVATPYDPTGEIGALKEIDEAIRRGDFARASTRLNEYDAATGTKHFAPEYQAARALVLCGSGETEAGQRAACAFFSAYPRSPVSARIEAACAAHCGERR